MPPGTNGSGPAAGFAHPFSSIGARAARMPRWMIPILIGVVAAILAVVVRQWLMGAWFDGWERANYDDLIRQHARYKPCKDYGRVILISIDSESEQDLGHFPWPRRTEARLVDELKRLGFSVIAFDVIFAGPSPHGPEDDQALAAAASRAGNVVWAAKYPDHPEEEGDGVQNPTPVLARARGSRIGFANVGLDADHVIRSIPAVYRDHGKALLPLSVAIVEQFRQRSTAPVVSGGKLRTKDYTIPLDAQGHFLIRYNGPAHPVKPPVGASEIRHISATDVLTGGFPDNFYKGKIALVGHWDQLDPSNPDDKKRTLPGDDLRETPYTTVSNRNDSKHDARADPLEGKMYGVEIMAQAVLSCMDRYFITPQRPLLTLLMLAVLGVLAAFITSRLSPWWALLPLAAIIILYWEAAQSRFLVHDQWMEIYSAPLTVLLSFVGVVTQRELLERRERWRTVNLFSRYVAPKVAKRLLTDPQAAMLGAGRAMDVTILFCDIRGFVHRSALLSPQEVMAWLSAHMETMVEAVHAEDGTVDKYLGDGLMAVFGAPERQEDHAARAVRAGLAIMAALDETNERRRAAGQWTYDIGIAIHSGRAMVGSMGHHARPEYAVLGDTVNLTFRLEARTKEFHARTLISRETYEAAGAAARDAVYLGSVELAGYEKTLEMYRLG